MTPARALALAVTAFLASACARKSAPPTGSNPGPSASSPASATASAVVLPAPVASGYPEPERVSAVVNPNGEHAYAGPAGTVRGRVVVTGDAPPAVPGAAKIPASCAEGREGYGRVFREGPGRTLADALVAVTGYKGYVPERAAAQRLEAKGCFFGTRTLALTYGQRIEVVSKDAEAYIPELLGEHGQPQLVATPGGIVASSLYPTRVGRYVLIDNLKLFMTAEVLVLKYATHAITGLDGRFEIRDVPAGSVVVSVLLPATGISSSRPVTVEGGKPTEDLVFELPFDAKSYAAHAAELDGGIPPVPNAKGDRPPAPTSTAPKPASSR